MSDRSAVRKLGMMASTSSITRHPVLTYFALTFAISWGGFVLVVGSAMLTEGTLFLVGILGLLSSILYAPLAAQEMVLAVWLIFKGFGASAVADREPQAPGR